MDNQPDHTNPDLNHLVDTNMNIDTNTNMNMNSNRNTNLNRKVDNQPADHINPDLSMKTQI